MSAKGLYDSRVRACRQPTRRPWYLIIAVEVFVLEGEVEDKLNTSNRNPEISIFTTDALHLYIRPSAGAPLVHTFGILVHALVRCLADVAKLTFGYCMRGKGVFLFFN